MKTLHLIASEVHQWSLNNFGHNPTSYLSGRDLSATHPEPLIVHLDWMCPLLGLQEELGELAEETDSKEIEDAIGDIGIYLCDFCSRIGIPLPAMMASRSRVPIENTMARMTKCLGQINHAILKRFQGIRGFDHPQNFKEHLTTWTHQFLVAVIEHAHQKNPKASFLMILNETWNRVQKRDWNKNKVDGSNPV